MEFIRDLFEQPPVPPEKKQEVSRLLEELYRIGKMDDFLSETPGSPFNLQCRHIRARDIGNRMNELGGLPLMEYIHRKVRRKLGKNLSAHLEYAWAGIGKWLPGL